MPGKSQKYENNPFYIALNGLNLVFEKARGVAFLLIALSILSVFSGGMPRSRDDNGMNAQIPAWPMEQWIIVGCVGILIALAYLFITAMISGISAYTSAQVALGNTVKLGEAFHEVLDKFFSFIWLQIIMGVKILLWSLLLIIPGIVMAYRYSLANMAFFDQNLRGNAAIKESLRLTKGAWLTTFGAQFLFNIITLGVISEFVNAGAKVILYRQFKAIGNDEKPDAHGLSWFSVFFPLIFAVAVMAVIVSIVLIALLIKAIA